ncbi:MAG: alanine racemase [Erysipelotrichaceae bacterium]
MLEAKSRTWTEIDLSNIEHNINEIKKLVPSTSKIMAIVKANAYGHGAIEVAKVLANIGIDFLAVSSVDEAVELRNNNINTNILILGYTPIEHFHYLKDMNLVQSALSLDYANKLNNYAIDNNTKLRVHIKLDTGMSRIGIMYVEDDKHLDEVKAVFDCKGLLVEGIFSHFSVADDLTNEENILFTNKQKELFDEATNLLINDNYDIGVRHLQNSYGVLNYNDLNYEYVRPGLLIYGSTSDDAIKIKTNPNFKPVMQWFANISLVKNVKANRSISYGRNFISNKPMKIGTVAVGYADGFPRNVSNLNAKVLVKGKSVNVIGNVCMDQMMIDLSNIDDVHEGDIVTIIGNSNDKTIKIDELSRLAKTINNDMFCRISYRVPRIIKNIK